MAMVDALVAIFFSARAALLAVALALYVSNASFFVVVA